MPCVVLAHGFSLVREGRLDAYAERFADAGMAVLVFDYRYFGASGGRPRQLIDIDAQRNDWTAAIGCARGLEGIDAESVALWGTSFSGGHVVPVAVADGRVAAVISQVPFTGLGGRGGRRRIAHPLALLAAGLRDELRALMGREPAYIPVAEVDGCFAAFDDPAAIGLIRTILPESGGTWENRFTPRVILRMATNKPFADAAELRCPWMLCLADDDATTPADVAAERAAPAPALDLRRYPTGHFQTHTGEWFERIVSDQLDFLRRNLLSG